MFLKLKVNIYYVIIAMNKRGGFIKGNADKCALKLLLCK